MTLDAAWTWLRLHAVAYLGLGAFALGLCAQLDLFVAHTTSIYNWRALTVTATVLATLLVSNYWLFHRRLRAEIEARGDVLKPQRSHSVSMSVRGSRLTSLVPSERDKMLEPALEFARIQKHRSSVAWQGLMFSLAATIVYALGCSEALWIYDYTNTEEGAGFQALLDAGFVKTTAPTFVFWHKILMLLWLEVGGIIGAVGCVAHCFACYSTPKS